MSEFIVFPHCAGLKNLLLLRLKRLLLTTKPDIERHRAKWTRIGHLHCRLQREVGQPSFHTSGLPMPTNQHLHHNLTLEESKQKKLYSINFNTDLGRLIGIFDYGYSTTVQKQFFWHSEFTWNQLVDLRWSKTAVLIILEVLNVDFWKNFTLEMSKVPKNTKFRAAQIVGMAVLGASKGP